MAQPVLPNVTQMITQAVPTTDLKSRTAASPYLCTFAALTDRVSAGQCLIDVKLRRPRETSRHHLVALLSQHLWKTHPLHSARSRPGGHPPIPRSPLSSRQARGDRLDGAPNHIGLDVKIRMHQPTPVCQYLMPPKRESLGANRAGSPGPPAGGSRV